MSKIFEYGLIPHRAFLIIASTIDNPRASSSLATDVQSHTSTCTNNKLPQLINGSHALLSINGIRDCSQYPGLVNGLLHNLKRGIWLECFQMAVFFL
jgi:hypothetical protein